MDKYIVAQIHPFVLEQEINTYVDGECVQTIKCTLDNMCERIYMLCQKYDIFNVHFYGGQLYALKFKDEFAACKYGNRPIEIHIH